ncbi:MAG: RND family transporter [Bradymonadaceae bacterium]
MNPAIEKFISRFVHRFVARYYVRITLVSVLVTAVAVWVIANQWNINSDIRALLPQDSDAAQAMKEVGNRVGSGSALFIVVDSPDMEANKQFAADFAEKLREIPSVALAHYHNDKEFFEKRKLLFLKQHDLAKLRKRIADKIEEKKKKANPLFASLDTEEDEESDQFVKTDDLRQKYDHLGGEARTDYFVAEDRHSLTMIVRFTESSTDMAATNKLIRKVKETGQQLDPSAYHSELTLEYGGGLINRQEDYGSIVSDIKSSAVFTLLGLLLVIALYFRRVRATALVMIPLVMGVAWTLAMAFAVFGELTTVSVFIFAILLGLGIDYSIHLLTGYDHLRLEGRDPEEALIRTYQGVGSATVIGAMTTLATFVVISFADFRGLSQFGQVATTGVAFTLTAMIVVLPSLILTFNHIWPHNVDGRASPEDTIPSFLAMDKIERFAPLAVALAIGFTAISVTQYDHLAFEEDFRQLGEVNWPWERIDNLPPIDAIEDDAREDAKKVAERVYDQAVLVREDAAPETFEKERLFETTVEKYESALRGKRSSTPTVLLFDEPSEVRRVTKKMRRMKRQGKLDTIRSVSSAFLFVPGTQKTQKTRLAEIEKIEELLDNEDLSSLDKKDRKKLEDFREKLDMKPFTVHNLPTWTKRLFKEAGEGSKPASDGEEFAFEYIIYVNEAVDQMKGDEARRFLDEIQQVKKQTQADFQIGSQSYVYVQMLDEIQRDGLKMISIALVLVFLLLALAFRSPLRGLVAMTPLILGAIWMFGMLAWVGLRLDFFNIVIIPVVIGIGVDAGVHFYRRYLERGRGSVGIVTRTVGSAVTMASVTSGIGFGGLAITDHGGLSSIGHLAILGISTTLVATLLIMPVILWAVETYDIDWLLPRESDLSDLD